MSVIIDTVTAIRNLRHESNINPAQKIRAILSAKKWKKLLEEKREPICRLAGLGKLEILEKAPVIHPALTHFTAAGVEILLPLEGLVDIQKERGRLNEEKENLENYLRSLESKLGNSNFRERAPAQIVKAEEEKLKSAKFKLEKILDKLNALK